MPLLHVRDETPLRSPSSHTNEAVVPSVRASSLYVTVAPETYVLRSQHVAEEDETLILTCDKWVVRSMCQGIRSVLGLLQSPRDSKFSEFLVYQSPVIL